jgi:class 3 adenylate cyclase
MSHTAQRPIPHLLTSKLGRLLTRRIRYQIVVPYLVLATLFALAGTYLFLNSASRSLHERFNSQLLDAARGGADSLAQAEMQQLSGLRALIYTEGFADALVASDKDRLAALAAPQALNYSLDHVIITAADGKVLLTLPDKLANGVSRPGGDTYIAPLVSAVFRSDGETDKISAVVDSPTGPVFYAAGPVRQSDKVIGIVLVGVDLSRVLRQMARSSLSDSAAFYAPGGELLGYDLPASEATPLNFVALPEGWYDQIVTNPEAGVRLRTVTLSDGTYVEALAAAPGRGPEGEPPGVYGVTLSTRTLDGKLHESLWTLVPLFALGLLLIILVGRAIAAWIDRPVAQLVAASEHVSRGNLHVEVPTNREDELGVLSRQFNDMVAGLRQLIVVKDLFGRFVSPEVATRLMSGEIVLGGEQRVVTVLFSDLRDFSRLSEERPPHEIVDLLNEYFRSVVRAANMHGGIVNKFGGDSTMIIFGAPVDAPDHADRALATALEMRTALSAINAHRTQEGWEPLRQGMGINTGIVVAGQIGSEDRMDYTVIGDAVNIAARLQAMTKEVEGGDIIFSEDTRAALTKPDDLVWKDHGEIEVRGKSQPARVYTLVGPKQPVVEPGRASARSKSRKTARSKKANAAQVVGAAR